MSVGSANFLHHTKFGSSSGIGVCLVALLALAVRQAVRKLWKHLTVECAPCHQLSLETSFITVKWWLKSGVCFLIVKGQTWKSVVPVEDWWFPASIRELSVKKIHPKYFKWTTVNGLLRDVWAGIRELKRVYWCIQQELPSLGLGTQGEYKMLLEPRESSNWGGSTLWQELMT